MSSVSTVAAPDDLLALRRTRLIQLRDTEVDDDERDGDGDGDGDGGGDEASWVGEARACFDGDCDSNDDCECER